MVLFVDLLEVILRGFYKTDVLFGDRFGFNVGKIYESRHNEMMDLLLDLFRGKMTEEDYWRGFRRDQEVLNSISISDYEKILGKNMLLSIEDSPELFREISENRGKYNITKMYLVSDNVKERIPYIKENRRDVWDLFDGHIFSCDLGMIKQDEGFFEKVLAMTNTNPEDVVYIDDWQKNLDAAKKAGIKETIKFVTAKDLRDELKLRFGFF